MTKYPSTQLPKEARSPKSELGHWREGFLRRALPSINFCEDQVKFLGFLPEESGVFAKIRNCFYNHPQEKLCLPSLLFTVADFLFEFLFETASSASQ